MLDRPRNLPVQSEADNSFMPGFDSDDYAPPEFRLIQPTSKAHIADAVPLGYFHCESTGETTQILTFSILHVRRTLTLWGEDMAFPACASDDRIMPRPGGAFLGPCGECSQRNKNCFPGYNILCVREGTTGDPEPEVFLLRVTGTSVFPFRKLWPKIKTRYNNQPWRALITLGSELKSNNRGNYHVMVPGDPSDLTPEEAQRVLTLARLMAGLDIGAVDAQAQQAHIEAPAAPTTPPPDPRQAFPDASQPSRQALARGVRQTIQRERAEQIVKLATDLGVPAEIVTDFISTTFQCVRLLELRIDEADALEKWLHSEFDAATQDWRNNPVDNLPF